MRNFTNTRSGHLITQFSHSLEMTSMMKASQKIHISKPNRTNTLSMNNTPNSVILDQSNDERYCFQIRGQDATNGGPDAGPGTADPDLPPDPRRVGDTQGPGRHQPEVGRGRLRDRVRRGGLLRRTGMGEFCHSYCLFVSFLLGFSWGDLNDNNVVGDFL